MDSHFVAAHDTDRETIGASRTVLERPANTDQTLDASSNRTPNDDNANEDEGMPEVMSTPQQPTTMMRFDTLEFHGEMQSLLSYSCKQTGAQEYMVDYIAKFVPGYGNKSFKVHANVEEGFYMCECYKYERDGIVCCHVLRIMVQLGATTLPAAYILKRWTWLAKEMLVDMSSQVPGKVHEMPEESVILMKTTLMKNEFALLAKVWCRTVDGRKIIGASSARSVSAVAARASAMFNSATPGVYTGEAVAGSNNHGHSSHAAASGLQIQGQIASMSVMGAYAWPMAAATDPISTPVDGSDKHHHSSHVVAPEPIIRDPEKSNTKGRKRKKSFQHPLDIGKREKRTCRLCGSNTHDARTCSTRDKPPPLQTEEELFS
ncbi:hypothetical protein ZWY2020_008717 [Hordeum vulgare]|nr:hypothetical protein ZWY2020_008717 [Hordeum vulgare]